MIITFLIIYYLSWITCHFLCEFKYFWCKGKCEKCKNWKCKYFKECIENDCELEKDLKKSLKEQFKEYLKN